MDQVVCLPHPETQPGEDAQPVLAAVMHRRGFDLDGLLAEVCRVLAADGLKLGGVLHVGAGEGTIERACCTQLKVVDVAKGDTFDIWQDLGSQSEGCRLDARGLAAAVPAVLAAIAEGCDLVIINRFGKAESQGGGLLAAITAAIEANVPVLTAVREAYLPAWSEFHGGLAADLAPDLAAVLAWSRKATQRRQPAATLPAAPSS